MAGIGAALRGISKILLKSSKQKTTGTGAINSVKPGKRLKEKRDIQDSVVKSKDKTIAVLNEEGKITVRTTVPLKKTNKKIAEILDKKK